jgi:hypothetical protein
MTTKQLEALVEVNSLLANLNSLIHYSKMGQQIPWETEDFEAMKETLEEIKIFVEEAA